MTEISLATKAMIFIVILILSTVCAWLGFLMLSMKEKIRELRNDRNNLIESRAGWELEMIRKNLELSDTQKKLIVVALTLPAFKKDVKSQGLKEVHEHLLKTIQDSIDV